MTSCYYTEHNAKICKFSTCTVQLPCRCLQNFILVLHACSMHKKGIRRSNGLCRSRTWRWSNTITDTTAMQYVKLVRQQNGKPKWTFTFFSTTHCCFLIAVHFLVKIQSEREFAVNGTTQQDVWLRDNNTWRLLHHQIEGTIPTWLLEYVYVC